MSTILVVSVIIVIIVLLLSVITTSKAYTYKHTVDPRTEEKKDNSINTNDENH
ncbi:MAG: YtzI protein [Bacillota bacterium]|nr:YtzI protein [Bacillota bacterium]MDP4171197.1 YtzI protein [Bacillota bacterium]